VSASIKLGEHYVPKIEVTKAFNSSHQGQAEGVDGIPLCLYRHFYNDFVPLLSRLFTAIRTSSTFPEGSTEGIITSLYKRVPRRLLKSYRHITLINSDYRLLARCLASQLGTAIGDVIDPMQTAFLKGRKIGDNITLLQLISTVVQCITSEGLRSHAVVAFLDFFKAYDTVNRNFLLSVMESMGVGDSFLAWTRLFLYPSPTRAMVNGFVSSPLNFEGGVRQGCPLSPFFVCSLVKHCLAGYLLMA
jgi:hypothetical protein